MIYHMRYGQRVIIPLPPGDWKPRFIGCVDIYIDKEIPDEHYAIVIPKCTGMHVITLHKDIKINVTY